MQQNTNKYKPKILENPKKSDPTVMVYSTKINDMKPGDSIMLIPKNTGYTNVYVHPVSASKIYSTSYRCYNPDYSEHEFFINLPFGVQMTPEVAHLLIKMPVGYNNKFLSISATDLNNLNIGQLANVGLNQADVDALNDLTGIALSAPAPFPAQPSSSPIPGSKQSLSKYQLELITELKQHPDEITKCKDSTEYLVRTFAANEVSLTDDEARLVQSML